ncbi:septal ring lytic transglycosylase RlpA family protein [Salinisphaera sp. Q1T1-3]|uniref:septal ring lytic transglycosylase RlpA family protein n=1 Tax=Salinisphaera sp. Q1T1-3 TaxID=2321229 RepID=UPI000E748FEA|nr:septal ring lytic transglycosylase RlpA family protein [Salinisphaera sp. Q1T1-3]RJS94641.1 septal ring lytic transglycosylase RlpA family protein [Salinisphaera sp. Q1T1-3]
MNGAGPDRLARRLLAALASTGLLFAAGCAHHPAGGGGGAGGGYYQDDGPPDDTNVDIAAIPDAVPKHEPLSKYGNPKSYTALGKRYYVLKSAAGFTQTGRASWYGRQFHGERTSSGEPYNMFSMTAAHKRLPIPSWVQVTNLNNGRQIVVKVNDRGPFHDGRIIDLSYVAARKLGIVSHGSAPVRIRTVTPDDYNKHRIAANDTDEPDAPLRSAANPPPDGAASTQPATTASSVADRGGPASPSTVHHSRANGDMLQIGAFSGRGNAQELKSRIEGDGFGPVVILAPTSRLALYRVRVGPFSTLAHRDAVARRLVADGYAVRRVKR